MLGPTCRLGTPDGHLVVLIAVRELVRAAIVDVQALAHLCKVSRCKRALGDSGGERLAVVASRAALPFCEPFAVEEGAVYEEVVDVLLPHVTLGARQAESWLIERVSMHVAVGALWVGLSMTATGVTMPW